MPTKSKPHRKLDPNFVSSQKWEIQYIADKFKKEDKKVTPELVRNLKKKVGSKSRRKLYAAIRQWILSKTPGQPMM